MLVRDGFRVLAGKDGVELLNILRHAWHKLVTTVVIALMLGAAGCRALPFISRATPTPIPDPLATYRPALQRWAQDEVENMVSLPRYSLRAELAPGGEQLTGYTRVVVPNGSSSEWPELVFRLYPNTAHYASEIEVHHVKSGGQTLDSELSPDRTWLRVRLPEALLPGEEVTVTMQYMVRLAQGRDDYTLFGWEDGILSLPGFYPALAVYSNGVGDNPGRWLTDLAPEFADISFNALAFYDLEFVAPAELAVVAAGSTVESRDTGNGSRVWHVSGGPLRDMTVIASDRWGSKSQSAAGATVTSYYPAGAESAGEAALFHASAALGVYADLYGPYPYTEFDIVAVPLGYRGMEYSGLVTIGEELYGPHRDQLAFLVAHETAHEWWYAQVGNDPLRYPWLDEGLADYAVFDYYRAIYGLERAEDLRNQRWLLPTQSKANQGLLAGPVARSASDMTESNYQLLAYAKSALFFDAMREQLGDDIYSQVLRSYVEEYQWQLASPQNFLSLAQRVSGEDLNPLVERWLR